MVYAQTLHQRDLTAGYSEVEMPYALARKYPHAAKDWRWQYIFPSFTRSIDPSTGHQGRHRLSADRIQKSMKLAVRAAGINKDVKTTMIYTHVLNRGGGRGVISPLDI